jgi:hypothetical protein
MELNELSYCHIVILSYCHIVILSYIDLIFNYDFYSIIELYDNLDIKVLNY